MSNFAMPPNLTRLLKELTERKLVDAHIQELNKTFTTKLRLGLSARKSYLPRSKYTPHQGRKEMARRLARSAEA